ncbi:hypothetical protein ACFBZI_11280 [Moraxella sp. ZJ142]|uniref:hypothetical protein n=1 Tax=Moraxella marmotae TaxID=3344520 RepID=UPI0035D40F51
MSHFSNIEKVIKPKPAQPAFVPYNAQDLQALKQVDARSIHALDLPAYTDDRVAGVIAQTVNEYYQSKANEQRPLFFAYPTGIPTEYDVCFVVLEGEVYKAVPFCYLTAPDVLSEHSFKVVSERLGVSIAGVFCRDKRQLARIRLLFASFATSKLMTPYAILMAGQIQRGDYEDRCVAWICHHLLYTQKLVLKNKHAHIHDQKKLCADPKASVSALQAAFDGLVNRVPEDSGDNAANGSGASDKPQKDDIDDLQNSPYRHLYPTVLRHRLAMVLHDLGASIDELYQQYQEAKQAEHRQKTATADSKDKSDEQLSTEHQQFLQYAQNLLPEESPTNSLLHEYVVNDRNDRIVPYFDLKKSKNEQTISQQVMPLFAVMGDDVKKGALDGKLPEFYQQFHWQTRCFGNQVQELVRALLNLLGETGATQNSQHQVFFNALIARLYDTLSIEQALEVFFTACDHANGRASIIFFKDDFKERLDAYIQSLDSNHGAARRYIDSLNKATSFFDFLIAGFRFAEDTLEINSGSLSLMHNLLSIHLNSREDLSKNPDKPCGISFKKLMQRPVGVQPQHKVQDFWSLSGYYDYYTLPFAEQATDDNKQPLPLVNENKVTAQLQVQGEQVAGFTPFVILLNLPKSLSQKQALISHLAQVQYRQLPLVQIWLPYQALPVLQHQRQALIGRLKCEDLLGNDYLEPQPLLDCLHYSADEQKAAVEHQQEQRFAQSYRLPMLTNCLHSGDKLLAARLVYEPMGSMKVLNTFASLLDSINNPMIDDDTFEVMGADSSRSFSFVDKIHTLAQGTEYLVMSPQLRDIDSNPEAAAYNEASAVKKSLYAHYMHLQSLGDLGSQYRIYFEIVKALISGHLIIPFIRYEAGAGEPTLQELLKTKIPPVPRCYLRQAPQLALFLPATPFISASSRPLFYAYISGSSLKGDDGLQDVPLVTAAAVAQIYEQKNKALKAAASGAKNSGEKTWLDNLSFGKMRVLKGSDGRLKIQVLPELKRRQEVKVSALAAEQASGSAEGGEIAPEQSAQDDDLPEELAMAERAAGVADGEDAAKDTQESTTPAPTPKTVEELLSIPALDADFEEVLRAFFDCYPKLDDVIVFDKDPNTQGQPYLATDIFGDETKVHLCEDIL